MSPVLSGYRKFNDFNDSKETDSLVEWEDAISDKFGSCSNFTESAGGNKDSAESFTNKSSANTSEYVDHDFPCQKTAQMNQAMHQTSQEYLPHSGVKMTAVQSANNSAAKPSIFSNCKEADVEKANPIVDNKLSYENPFVSTKPEHYYYDIDEIEAQPKSNDSVDKTDDEERIQIDFHQIGQSNDTGSIPQLDSYTVAHSGNIIERKGAEDNYSMAVVENAGQSRNLEEEIDGHILLSDDNAVVEFDFGLDDEVHSDKISLSKCSAASSYVSSVDIFGHSASINSAYANPDVLSLGSGSTISDVSEAESTVSDNFVNKSPNRDLSPELQSEKSAICHDIQALVEPDFVNKDSQISDTALELNVENPTELDNVPNQNSRSKGESYSSGNRSVENKPNSSESLNQSYTMVGFTSSNHSIETVPTLDTNKVVKVEVDLNYECTHL